METNMINILKKIDNYDYFVLRDYSSEYTINNCTDVDMYVNKKDIKNVSNILKEQGFILQKMASCKYPHLQFKKISDRIYRFDIITDFVYGQNKYSFSPIKNSIKIDSCKTNFGIKIPNDKFFLYAMLFHILFDKSNFSEKNYQLLKDELSKFDFNNIDDQCIKEILEMVLNSDIDICNQKIDYFKKMILSNKILRLKKNKVFLDFKIYVKRIINGLSKRIKKRNIAVIGVDGSGKSSTIEDLKNIFGSECKVIYMGLKDFKYKFCRENDTFEGLDNFGKLKFYTLLYFDYLYRYFKYRFTSKIVIFDRYIYDILISSKKPKSILDKIFYKGLYPKPKLVFYLYCDVKTSLKRKDDINNVKRFEENKKNYDLYVKNNKKIIAINSDENTKEDVIKIVTNIINKYKF